MTLYVVKNNQNASLSFTNASGSPTNIAAGQSATVDLTASQYTSAVLAVGAANVVLVSTAAYRYCTTAYAMVATPTDAFVLQGSATALVHIKKIKITGQATAQGSMPVQLFRRLSTGGTPGSAVLTAIVAAKNDPADPAPTAVVSSVGTANYTTVQTSAGLLSTSRLGMSALGTGTAGDGQRVLWEYSNIGGDKPIYLRGATDYIMINFNGAAIPAGGVVDIEIETEEAAT